MNSRILCNLLLTSALLLCFYQAKSQYRKPKRSLYVGLTYAHLRDDVGRVPTLGLGLDYQRIFTEFFALRFGFNFQRSYPFEDYDTWFTYRENAQGEVTFIEEGYGYEARYNQLSVNAGPVFYVREKFINFYLGANFGMGIMNFPFTVYRSNPANPTWFESREESGLNRNFAVNVQPRIGLEFKLGPQQEQIVDFSIFYDGQWVSSENLRVLSATGGVHTVGFQMGYRFAFKN